MLNTFKIIIFCLALMLPEVIYGQVTSRVAGLEGNTRYMELLTKEKELHGVEDSIFNTIKNTRALFSDNNEDKDRYAVDILRLEQELFEIRNKIGVLASGIGMIEQEFVINSLMSGGTAERSSVKPVAKADTAPRRSNLIYNNYFKDNVPPPDYASLSKAQELEILPPKLVQTYTDNYRRIVELVKSYEVAERPEAEEMQKQYTAIESLNTKIADSLSSVWGYIYDNKIYAYNYLLDKMNLYSVLSDFERKTISANDQIASAADRTKSETLYTYGVRKNLLLSYELNMADILKLKSAYDSILLALKDAEKINYDLPRVKLEERIFIPYSDITISIPSKYNSSNPIPVDEIFDKGTVYKVQVGVFSRSQPVSIFRGAHPLSYERMEDGRYRYFAGAFREQNEAEAAVNQLKSAGFRNPIVVVWRDGIMETVISDVPAVKDDVQAVYRVEFKEIGDNIRDIIRQTIDSLAPNKELSRIADTVSQVEVVGVTPEAKYTYSVGSFDNMEAANKLAGAINSISESSAKVLTLSE